MYRAFNGQPQEILNFEHGRQDEELPELKGMTKLIDKTAP